MLSTSFYKTESQATIPLLAAVHYLYDITYYKEKHQSSKSCLAAERLACLLHL